MQRNTITAYLRLLTLSLSTFLALCLRMITIAMMKNPVLIWEKKKMTEKHIGAVFKTMHVVEYLVFHSLLTSIIMITGAINAQTKCVSYLNQQLWVDTMVVHVPEP